MDIKIGIIIVLYYSKDSNFECLLNQPNLSIILIDNTPGRNLKFTNKSINYIPLDENKGIAAAQNIGIEKAKEINCSYIVFFDQDSIFSANYINQILSEYIRLKNIILK